MNPNKNERFLLQQQLPPDSLSGVSVAVVLPDEERGRPASVRAFMLAANLAARLFPRLQLLASRDAEVPTNPWAVARLSDLEAILDGLQEGYHPVWGSPSSPVADIVLSIGRSSTAVGQHSVFVDYSDWSFSIDVAHSAPSPDGVFGPLLAACAGVAQAFLHAVTIAGGRRRPIEPYEWSLLNLSFLPGAPDLSQSRIPDAHLVGLGAVGSAAVYALGHFPGLSGRLDLIDNDTVDDTNLHRYALMRRIDLTKFKVDVAATALGGTKAGVFPFRGNHRTYLAAHGPAVPLLVTPVDSEEGRRELAKTLPARVLNAATGDSAVTLSHHGFGDGLACLHCLYLDSPFHKSKEQLWSEDLGFPVETVRYLLSSNKGLDAQAIRTIERHRGLSDGALAHRVGDHLQSLYQEAVCGNATVKVGGETLVAPLGFISAAAGVLLAAELVKLGTVGVPSEYNYFRWDVLSRPSDYFRQLRPQEPSGACICHDPIYKEVYQERYPS